jgi:hypothetical protein
LTGLSTSIQKGLWLRTRGCKCKDSKDFDIFSPYFVIGLLVLSIGKTLHIYARFRFRDKILAYSLANVKMISVHIMKIFTWMYFSMFVCNPNYIKIVYCNNGGFFWGSTMDFVTFAK